MVSMETNEISSNCVLNSSTCRSSWMPQISALVHRYIIRPRGLGGRKMKLVSNKYTRLVYSSQGMMGELVKIIFSRRENQPSFEHKMSTGTFRFHLTVYLLKTRKSAHFQMKLNILWSSRLSYYNASIV